MKKRSNTGKTSLGRLNIAVCPKHSTFMKRIDISSEEGKQGSAWLCRVCFPDILDSGKTSGTWKAYDYRAQPIGQWHRRMEEAGLLDLNRARDLRRTPKE